MRDKLARVGNCRFATAYALTWAQLKYLSYQYQKKAKAFNQLTESGRGNESLIHLNRPDVPLDDSDAYERMSNIWASSSLSMHAVLAARNILYFHFLQPNQYYPSGRRFSEAEKAIAISEGNAVQESVTNAYPRLIARMHDMDLKGVRVFNAVHAFDETPDIVYVDNTCHYNTLGSEVLAKHMARSILGGLSNSGSAKN